MSSCVVPVSLYFTYFAASIERSGTKPSIVNFLRLKFDISPDPIILENILGEKIELVGKVLLAA